MFGTRAWSLSAWNVWYRPQVHRAHIVHMTASTSPGWTSRSPRTPLRDWQSVIRYRPGGEGHGGEIAGQRQRPQPCRDHRAEVVPVVGARQLVRCRVATRLRSAPLGLVRWAPRLGTEDHRSASV